MLIGFVAVLSVLHEQPVVPVGQPVVPAGLPVVSPLTVPIAAGVAVVGSESAGLAVLIASLVALVVAPAGLPVVLAGLLAEHSAAFAVGRIVVVVVLVGIVVAVACLEPAVGFVVRAILV